MIRGYYPTRQPPAQYVDPAQVQQAQAQHIAQALTVLQNDPELADLINHLVRQGVPLHDAAPALTSFSHQRIQRQAEEHLHQARQQDLRAQFENDIHQRVYSHDHPDYAEVQAITERYRAQGLGDTRLPDPRPGSATTLQLARDRSLSEMENQQKRQQLESVMKTYGLDPSNDGHMAEVQAELQYATTHLQEGADSRAAAEKAVKLAAQRLGISNPLGNTKGDTRSFRERYLDQLPPAQRAQLQRAEDNRQTPQYEQGQQATLRAQFLQEINATAVDAGRGNQLNDRKAASIIKRYEGQGLKDTSLSAADLGQTPEVLAKATAKSQAVRHGWKPDPAFTFGGDNREQGHLATWTESGRNLPGGANQ